MIPGPGATGDEEGLDEFGAPTGAAWQPGRPVSGDGKHLPLPGTSGGGGTVDVPLPAPLSSPGPAWPGETGWDRPAGAFRRYEDREPPAPPARPHPAGTVYDRTNPPRHRSLPPGLGFESLRRLCMDNGRRPLPVPPLAELGGRCAEQLRRLRVGSLRLVNPHRYKVSMSHGLHRLRSRLMEDVEEQRSAPPDESR